MSKASAISITGLIYILFAAQPVNALPAIEHVFVIVMENTDATQIYGNVASAPYINNTLIPKFAHAKNFNDTLPALNSEPHYLLMEAGTNAFSDITFQTDGDPSDANSTASKRHLVTQMRKSRIITWKTYQEDMNADTGQCPIVSVFPYVAKHNPFVFFQDVSGSPPSKTTKYCIKHTKPYSALASDLAANKVANYVFISPNMCHDMHGDPQCPAGDRVTAGDSWLSSNLPRIIRWARKHSGVIFIMWDEGSATTQMPFLVIGHGVRANYSNNVNYDHGSAVKTIEKIFKLPILPAVQSKKTLAKMFKPGAFP